MLLRLPDHTPARRKPAAVTGAPPFRRLLPAAAAFTVLSPDVALWLRCWRTAPAAYVGPSPTYDPGDHDDGAPFRQTTLACPSTSTPTPSCSSSTSHPRSPPLCTTGFPTGRPLRADGRARSVLDSTLMAAVLRRPGGVHPARKALSDCRQDLSERPLLGVGPDPHARDQRRLCILVRGGLRGRVRCWCPGAGRGAGARRRDRRWPGARDRRHTGLDARRIGGEGPHPARPTALHRHASRRSTKRPFCPSCTTSSASAPTIRPPAKGAQYDRDDSSVCPPVRHDGRGSGDIQPSRVLRAGLGGAAHAARRRRARDAAGRRSGIRSALYGMLNSKRQNQLGLRYTGAVAQMPPRRRCEATAALRPPFEN